MIIELMTKQELKNAMDWHNSKIGFHENAKRLIVEEMKERNKKVVTLKRSK